MQSLDELLSEAPDAQREQNERERKEGYEIGPKRRKSASFEHIGSHDRGEMMNWVKNGQRL